MTEDITTVFCHACGERVVTLLEVCPKCGVTLMASQRRASTVTTALELVKLAEEIVVRLETRATPLAEMLASRGKVLAEGFAAWQKAMPEQRERSRQIQALGDWQAQALDYLSGGR